MEYLILIDGNVKGPFQVVHLLENGVSKKTRICQNGTEDWDVAENFRELDSLWETEQKAKKTLKKNVEIQKPINKDDIATLLPEIDEAIVEPSIVSDESNNDSEDTILTESLQEPVPNNFSKLAIKRMLISGLIILFAYMLGNWIFKPGIIKPPPPIIKNDTLIKVLNCQSRFDSILAKGEKGMKSMEYNFALSCFVSLSSTLQNCPNNKLAKVSINKLNILKSDYDKQAKIAREVYKIDNSDDLESRYKIYEKASLQLSEVLKTAKHE